MNLPSADEVKPVEPTSSSLGRAWVAPALFVAGLVGLLRADVMVHLGLNRGFETPELARWSALAEWPALLVQGLLMAAAAVAVVWSARGLRLFAALFISSLILTSAITGWPVAPLEQTLRGPVEGLPSLVQIAAGGLLASLLVALLAWFTRRSPGLERVMSSMVLLAVTAVPALGVPGYLLWRDSMQVPQMPVREVLAQLHENGFWRSTGENAEHPVRRGILNPYVDVGLKREEHDTFDQTALLMSPPAEVVIEIPAGAENAQLDFSAQIAGRHTNRGAKFGNPRKSDLDKLQLDGVAVRFEALLDGVPVFDSTITHRHADEARDRLWQNLTLTVQPGQQLTLRTAFADEGTARAFAGQELQCGFGGLLLSRWGTLPRTHATPTSPNILFLTIDTLRADRLSCYGYSKPTTPNLDALSREGLLFQRAFASSSWTWPSTASLFTGLLPYEHGVLDKQACNLDYRLDTLAEALQQQGYTTAAISANPLIDRTHQFDQGFETFNFAQHLRMGDEVIEDIETKLRELAQARFFFYVHLVDPHTPHRPLASELERLGGAPPGDFTNPELAGTSIDGMDHYAKQLARGEATDEFGVIHPHEVVPIAHAQWISDRYDASVGTADQYVGRILALLDELGLSQTTIVAVTSDHGEELLDHHMYGHGHSLHRELVQVPLLLAGPGIPRGVRIKAEVSNRHLAPTLARIGGTQLTQVTDPLDLLDSAREDEDVFYQASEGYWNGHGKTEMQGLRQNGHVVHFAPKGRAWRAEGTAASRTRLFSIDGDFSEQTNLASDPIQAEIAAKLVGKIVRSVQDQRSRQQGSSAGVGAAGLRVLKDLGYVGEDETLDDEVKGALPEKR